MSSLTTAPVYIINLDRRPDRWNHIQRVVKQCGFNNVQRVSAVDGKKLNVSQFVTPRALDLLRKPRVRHEDLGSAGAVGCYLSHVNVWKQIAESGVPSIVLEDDAVITSVLSRYNIYHNISDVCNGFDIVLLGYCLLRTPLLGPPPNARGTVVPYKGMFFGTTFYWLSPNGARKLLSTALPIDVQVDSYIGQHSDLIIGVHFPNLASQRGTDTDIQTPCYNCDSTTFSRKENHKLFSIKLFILVVFVLIITTVTLALLKTTHYIRVAP